ITALSQEYGIPTNFYTSEQLNKVQGDFIGSEFVKSVTGVDNVCERSAALASGNGRLIVKKTALDGVTIAVALRKLEVSF
ncbi:MAG: cobalamin biosynthesis protein, partial [Oscillospiraceae bacterium]